MGNFYLHENDYHLKVAELSELVKRSDFQEAIGG